MFIYLQTPLDSAAREHFAQNEKQFYFSIPTFSLKNIYSSLLENIFLR